MGDQEREEKTEEEKGRHHSKLIRLIAGLTAGAVLLLIIYFFWDEVSPFFYEYFWKPVLEDVDGEPSGYNLYNTLVYGLILIGIIVLAPLGLRKIGVKGREAAIGALPFIFVGSFARVFEDMGLLEGVSFQPFFVSPLIYVMVAIPLAASLFLGKVFKKVEVTMLSFGTAILASLIIILGRNFPEEVNLESLWILLLPGVWLIIAFVFKALKPNVRYFNGLSALMLFGQLLDGCATIFGVSYGGYVEKHPLSGALIGIDPCLFLAIKVVVAILLIYLLDKGEMDDDFKNVFKFAVIMLGLAPGARDALQIFLGF